jgi:ribulose-phosphate 3-epimerase
MPEAPVMERLRSVCPTLSIGVVSANLLSLGSELQLLERVGAHLAHVDVMDGCFCPMMTVGPPFIKALKTSLLKDCHLMISDPLNKVAEYVAAGADIITVHPEAGPYVHRTLQKMGEMKNAHDPGRGIVRGLGLCPGTPLEVLEPLLDEVDLISVLGINPGWKGALTPSTWKRLEKVQKLVSDSGRPILVALDGGITKQNITEAAASGADLVVAGSAVFDGKTPQENAQFMLGVFARKKTAGGAAL